MQSRPICLTAAMSRSAGSFNTCAMVIFAALIASGAFPEIVVAIVHGLAPQLLGRDDAVDEADAQRFG